MKVRKTRVATGPGLSGWEFCPDSYSACKSWRPMTRISRRWSGFSACATGGCSLTRLSWSGCRCAPNLVTDGALRFVDTEALKQRHRFYRIVPQSNYDPEE